MRPNYNYVQYVHVPVAMVQNCIIQKLSKEDPDIDSVIRFCDYCIREHSTEVPVPTGFDDFE